MRLPRSTTAAFLAIAIAVPAMTPAIAAAPSIDQGGATATEPARMGAVVETDVVSVYQTGPITASVRDAALAAAAGAGAQASIGRGFTAPMWQVRRGGTPIQMASAVGYAFPMAVTALPVETIRAVMGREVAGPISRGQVVMGATTAALRGAQVGDVIDIGMRGGATISFTIGRIGSEEEVGGTEIVMSLEEAALLGGTIDTRVVIFGFFDRAVLDGQLAAYGLSSNSKVRIRRSWDAPDPDNTLGMAATKAILGEFDMNYAGVSTYGWTAVGAAWRNAYLPASRGEYPPYQWINEQLTPIRAWCNVMVSADLTAALQEVVNSGLGGYIDVANTNSAGGCAVPGMARLSRITQALGSVSRHSWGQPLDTNTVTNCQGCVPQMNCTIVRIFRKHGFAWGGNFLTPDGMHFEWVGEARNTWQYPSKYCPNLPGGSLADTGPPPPSARSIMFADDGMTSE
ncbi:MAG: M15 family metallopeptidase [Ilumatobacteraceae bacterium]